MVTMMEHPKHGRHPAMGHEIEALKASGWTVMPPKEKQAPVQESSSTEEEPRQKRKYTRKT
jgi:hypothetical protein